MSTKIVNTCTAPDGTEFKRTSSSGRKYSHAVIGQSSNGSWHATTWHSRYDLALKAITINNGKVVPVTALEKEVKDKPSVRLPKGEFEREGIVFKPHTDHSARAEYKGYRLEVCHIDRTFRGQAIKIDENGHDDWRFTKYAENGGLDSRVKKLKELVDQATA